MLSPMQLDHLEEVRTRSTAAILIGWMLLVFAGLLMVFFDSEFRYGIHFMQQMSTIAGIIGCVVLLVGALIRRTTLRKIEREHAQDFEAREGASKAMQAGAGH